MAIEVKSLVRENILRLAPYSSARNEFSGEAGIFLDANENSFGSPLDRDHSRYPDPLQNAVKQRIAEINDLNPGQVFVGSGSDEAIDLLFRIFCRPGVDNIVICPPTYGVYEVAAGINDIEVRRASLTDGFELDVDAVLKKVDGKTKLVFLCSPNNPTGKTLSRDSILNVARSFDGITVVDEAYIHFSGQGSLCSEIKKLPMLVVLQTFSKAWGLAGLRVGCAFAETAVIDLFNKVKAPYNVSGIAQELVLEALGNREQVDKSVSKIIRERSSLADRLAGRFEFVRKVFPSDANFILVKMARPEEVYSCLLEHGIIVRDRSRVELCEGCLRITVGTRGENDKLLEVLAKYEKKVLFIDRDGTLIVEPDDLQVNSFSKLKLLPGVIANLGRIAAETDYELVMVTNQDGLGTDSFLESDFYPIHELLIEILKGEDIRFADVCIDRSFEHENKLTRKPGTGLLTKYLNGDYDLAGSFVIGDRETDVQLAQNLGARAIHLKNPNFDVPQGHHAMVLAADTWREVCEFLIYPARKTVHRRSTKETDICVALNLDGTGESIISTGLPFFDHMLEQLATHGLMDLEIKVKGDLHIDEHHTIEDVAITLGEAFSLALGDKRGIGRYGFTLPMDDCLASVAVDLGGRNWIVWDADFKREKIGDMPTEMFFHFFKSFSDKALCNLNIKAEGTNEHHKIEAIFKACARALRLAVGREGTQLPSTKGVL